MVKRTSPEPDSDGFDHDFTSSVTGKNVHSVIAAKSLTGAYQNVQSDYSGNLNTAIQTDAWSNLAIAEVYNTYGDRVIVKPKTLFNWGSNSDLDAAVEETVWNVGGLETYATSDTINTVVSTATGDTQVVKIEGHTLSDNALTFVVQSATLEGQTPVTLSTPLARVSRIYNSGTTNLTGAVTVYESSVSSSSSGVVTPSSGIHITIASGTQTSEKAATSLSQYDYGFITSLTGGLGVKTSANLQFKLQIRTLPGVFRTFYAWGNSGGTTTIPLYPYLVIPKNSDVRIF